MLKLEGITQAAIDGTTRKIHRLPFVSQMVAEEATMMALLWLHENAEDFDPDPDPPLGLLYVCARFRAYRLRHEAFRSRSLNGLIEKADENGTPRELGEALTDRSFSLEARIDLIDLLEEDPRRVGARLLSSTNGSAGAGSDDPQRSRMSR
jgi:hypothetical protein